MIVPRMFALVLMLLAFPAAPATETDPITVSVAVGPELVMPGDVGEAFLSVENTTAATTVDVSIEGVITYADGTTDKLIDVKPRNALTLEPEQGFEISLLFFVPEDAAQGPATFTGTVRVTKTDAPKKTKYKRPIIVSDSAAFTVVDP